MKKTKSQKSRHVEGWHERNRFLMEMRMAKITFEQYMDYIYGRLDRINRRAFKPYKPSQTETYNSTRSKDHRQKYQSVTTVGTVHATTKKELQRYTGTFIIGIATMHKSNAVPIISKEQAIDIARMSM